jgi:CHAT domain-containing protein/tetratricopeptide (TPR) repeat protein
MIALKRICFAIAMLLALSLSPVHAQVQPFVIAPWDKPQLDEAQAQFQQAVGLMNAGKYAQAIPLAKRGLTTFEKVLGPDHRWVGEALNILGLLYLRQGQYAEAEPVYKRALKINEKVFGPDHVDIGMSMHNLGQLYVAQARYAEAEPYYKRALAIFEKAGGGHFRIALALNSLAQWYVNAARYTEAEPLFKRALGLLESALGPEHPEVAIAVRSLAVFYRAQDRFAEAEPLYKRSLAILEKARGRDHPEVAEALNGLADLYYFSLGRSDDAERDFKRALAIREKALGSNHPAVADSLRSLALLYRDQKRFAEAEPLAKRSLAISEKALGPAHPYLALPLTDIASLYYRQDQFSDAEPFVKRALAIREKAFGPNHAALGLSLNPLAMLYEKQGRYADALPLVQRTIALGAANTAVALPVLFQSTRQNLINAAEGLSLGYETVQRANSSAVANAVSQLAARFATGPNKELGDLVRQDQDFSVEAEQMDKAFIKEISKPPVERKQALEDQLRKRIETVKTERNKIQGALNKRFPDYVALSKPQPLSIQDTQALLTDDEAVVLFDFGDKSYGWIVTRTNAEWTELKITAKELKTQVEALRDPLTYEIDPVTVNKLSDLKPYDTQLAYKLYQATFGVFGEQIASKPRLSLVTNGALTGLPPHLLVTKDPTGKELKDVDWFVRLHAITILPSVSSLNVLRKLSAASPATRPMIAFADPVFSKAERKQEQQKITMLSNRSITRSYRGTQLDVAALAEQLERLPGTRAEVEAIARVLQVERVDIHLGLAATETAVKRAKLDQHRIIYFATHGLVSGEIEEFTKTKAEPALVFTLPDNPTELDDGLLQASEVAQLKLNADWVVLSACNTAAENAPGAEALSGLARSFFYAGARSLLVSHWAVDDRATARLMIEAFRTNASEPTLSHAQALRKSMLAMLDKPGSEPFLHPRFWAPFVVVGEPAKRAN